MTLVVVEVHVAQGNNMDVRVLAGAVGKSDCNLFETVSSKKLDAI